MEIQYRFICKYSFSFYNVHTFNEISYFQTLSYIIYTYKLTQNIDKDHLNS